MIGCPYFLNKGTNFFFYFLLLNLFYPTDPFCLYFHKLFSPFLKRNVPHLSPPVFSLSSLIIPILAIPSVRRDYLSFSELYSLINM